MHIQRARSCRRKKGVNLTLRLVQLCEIEQKNIIITVEDKEARKNLEAHKIKNRCFDPQLVHMKEVLANGGRATTFTRLWDEKSSKGSLESVNSDALRPYRA